MIRDILTEIRGGSTTVRELSRKLDVEESALQGMLEFMVRKGLIRELHPECLPKGCRGCPYQGKCDQNQVVGYTLAERR